MTLKARLTALIDHANAILDAGFTLPCKVEALAMECEGRLVSVWVRFDNGMVSEQVIAATPLTVPGILNAVQCAFLVDFIEVQPADEFNPNLTAYATGYQPPSATDDGRPVTHSGPGVVQ